MPNVEGQVSQSVGAPVMPRVNLMPPEIAEAARFRRFQLAMGGAVVGAVAVVVALYMQAHGGVAGAQQQVDQANAQGTTLQSQLANLQSVQDVYTQVASREAMLTQAMGGELRMPDHVWLTTVSATETGATPTALPTGTTSATVGSIGNVQFAGIAFSHDDVAAWLDSLSKERGFVNPYFTSSTETAIGPKSFVTFASSTDINDKAESGRYSKPAGS